MQFLVINKNNIEQVNILENLIRKTGVHNPLITVKVESKQYKSNQVTKKNQKKKNQDDE